MATPAQQRIVPPEKTSPEAEKSGAQTRTENVASQFAEISESWRRCLTEHRVDAASRSKPNVITEQELSVSREPLAKTLAETQDEIDRLYAVVRQQEYVVLLCNAEGVAIHHRGDEARADEFKQWGIWLGGGVVRARGGHQRHRHVHR